MSKDLRKRAEALLSTDHQETPSLSTTEVKGLIQELQVHQVELEMQNEELKLTQVELAHSRDAYAELYDSAPVGYLTLDHNANILAANGTAALLLETDSADLVHRSFADFIHRDGQNEWFRFRQQCPICKVGSSVELLMRKQDGTPFYGNLECKKRGAHEADDERQCLLTVTDVTPRKEAEDALVLLTRELDARVKDRTAKLKASEERYRGLAEKTSDILFAFDRGGVLTYISPQIARYGYSAADIVGKSVLDFAHPDDRSHIEAALRATVGEGEPHPSEFRATRASGEYNWFEERSSLLFDAEHNVTGFIGVLRDITERKEAAIREQQILDRLKEFERAVNQGPAIIFRWRIAPNDWPVEMVTTNVSQIGYTAEDFLGGRVSWPRITHPEDTPRLEREVSDVLRSGTRSFDQQYRLIAKSREIRRIQAHNLVITDADGRPTHIQGVILDITQQHHLADERQESENRFRNIFEYAPLGIAIRDTNGRLRQCNAAYCDMLGYSEEELKKMQSADFVHRDDRRENREQIRLLVDGDISAFDIEIRYLRSDEQVIWVRKRVSMLPSVADVPRRLIALTTDITERKRTEELLVAHRARLRRLAAMLANAEDDERRRIAEGLHDDVAQLLTACSVMMGVASQQSEPAEVEQILEKADALLSEAGDKVRSLSFELASATLYQLGLREAFIELCNSMNERFGLEFSVMPGGPLDKLDDATATVLFKAGRELLFNVQRHADTREATITVEQRGNTLQLIVDDHGKGMQVDASDHNIDEGLGLFNIRERIQDLGGKMDIESTESKGTKVTLTVPLGE